MSDTATITQADLTHEVSGRTIPLPGAYTVDASHTTVDFVARHMMVSKVRGSFPVVNGTLFIGEEPSQSSLDVSVDVASVATRDENRDNHLRSADFFDVEQYPEMHFSSKAVRPGRGSDDWVLDGELTIKGISQPVTLDVEFLGAIADPFGGKRIGFTANGEVNREDFGLGWNMALEAGGVVVGKTVKIEIESELVKQEAAAA